VYWHKGKKNQCFGIDAWVFDELNEKVENLKIYAFLKKNILVFVYWHKGKKNQCFGIDSQAYQNEAHEKV